MKLLIITQKVDKNDPILGFFYRWIIEFSKYYEKITVICLYKGEYDLPKNVNVISLGKENGASRIKYIYRFYKYIISERKEYEKVFVHMNPIYIVLGGIFWRIMGKKIALWYTHKSVDLKLKIAEKLTNIIFSASKESFRLKSNKLRIVGHGIDTEYFKAEEVGVREIYKDGILNILHIGRITPVKNYEVILKALIILRDKYKINTNTIFVGMAINEDDNNYYKNLKEFINENNLNNIVDFVGAVNYNNIKEYYNKPDISVNMCPDGGMDKVVIESMSLGIPVFFSNRAFIDVFGSLHHFFYFEFNNSQQLADRIYEYIINKNKISIRKDIINLSKKFNIASLIQSLNNII